MSTDADVDPFGDGIGIGWFQLGIEIDFGGRHIEMRGRRSPSCPFVSARRPSHVREA
jgi:hypothetical protein